jgi:endonuclease/exonuclease/phosphatase family metal-dependent hydrolase
LIDYFDVAGSDRKLAVINLHLEAYDSGKGKIAQTKKLKKILDEERKAGNYVIAGGDFNQVFSGVDVSKYPEKKNKWRPGKIDEKEFSKGWQFKMDASVPTCRSMDRIYKGADKESFQYYMIDGFIVSDNIDVASVKTQDLEFKHSDHNPVVMTFMLK